MYLYSVRLNVLLISNKKGSNRFSFNVICGCVVG